MKNYYGIIKLYPRSISLLDNSSNKTLNITDIFLFLQIKRVYIHLGSPETAIAAKFFNLISFVFDFHFHVYHIYVSLSHYLNLIQSTLFYLGLMR